MDYESEQHILFSTSENGTFGQYVVESTVFAVGFDNDFIIAKRHPNQRRK